MSVGDDLIEEEGDLVEDQFLHPQVEALQVVELLLDVQEGCVAVLVESEVVVYGVAQLGEFLEDGPELTAQDHFRVTELTVFLKKSGIRRYTTATIIIDFRVIRIPIKVIIRRHCD